MSNADKPKTFLEWKSRINRLIVFPIGCIPCRDQKDIMHVIDIESNKAYEAGYAKGLEDGKEKLHFVACQECKDGVISFWKYDTNQPQANFVMGAKPIPCPKCGKVAK